MSGSVNRQPPDYPKSVIYDTPVYGDFIEPWGILVASGSDKQSSDRASLIVAAVNNYQHGKSPARRRKK